MQHIEIYTDGACKGNPGPGGWGVLLRSGDQEKALYGGEADTTNNRMELTAAIEALKALRRPVIADIYTDSQYLIKGLEEWLPAWKARGWQTADRKSVKNRDLWEQCYAQKTPCGLSFSCCDRGPCLVWLASAAATQYRSCHGWQKCKAAAKDRRSTFSRSRLRGCGQRQSRSSGERRRPGVKSRPARAG
ncbi:MAG: ribonuclease HI, partial [Betaproteobacteria bacterium]|nr:ribonuclease HI [Betaproteobacteria bacterium]